MAKRDILQRIQEKYVEEIRVPELGPCWIWTASVDGRGYGQISKDGSPRRAHRVAYELLVGEIPDQHDLDHLCRVIRCINPAHLDPVSHRVNVLRGVSPQAINAAKTHCPKGHEYTAANTYLGRGNGWRQCRACERARQARLWRAKRAAAS